MPHKRDWLAGLQCLFAVIPDAPRDGWPEALGLTIRSWKTDTPHVLARERRTFEGEDEAARVYALRLSLATCADAIKAARILAARKLPSDAQLVSVLQTARPLLFEQNTWKLRAEPARGPLLDAVAIQLENYRPEHDIDGAAIPYADWEQWYRSIQVRGLSNSICHRKDPSASACQVAIFATIQWMYYALWCKRITFEHMPTHKDLLESIIRQEVLTFHATPGEIGWANKVGVDVAFLNRHLLSRMGVSHPLPVPAGYAEAILSDLTRHEPEFEGWRRSLDVEQIQQALELGDHDAICVFLASLVLMKVRAGNARGGLRTPTTNALVEAIRHKRVLTFGLSDNVVRNAEQAIRGQAAQRAHMREGNAASSRSLWELSAAATNPGLWALSQAADQHSQQHSLLKASIGRRVAKMHGTTKEEWEQRARSF